MEYRALVSFSGAISMSMGEVKNIEDETIIKDLLNAGYIEPAQWEEPRRRSAAVKDESKLNDNQSAPRVRGQRGGKTKK